MRSSATAEDTAATSFAGMNETFLNIRGADAVIDAVRRCWRSLFGARTIYYRGVNGFAQADMDIAVVVQRQVQSTRAGVMFTVNPATGQRDELVIEGSFGLGEAVVSGSVSPDRYVVEKATLAIRRREVHHKDLADRVRARRRHRPARALRGGGAAAGAQRRGGRRGRRARPAHRGALRLAPGHRVGVRPRRRRCGCSRAARSLRCTRRRCDTRGAGAVRAAGRAAARPGRRAGQRQRRRARAHLARRRREPERRRRARHPHDLSGLAAAAAPRRGRRHRLRRHDLPRRDRLARAGHPLRRRHRRSDAQAARRRDRDRRRHPRRRPRGRTRERAGAGVLRRAGNRRDAAGPAGPAPARR